MTLKAGTVCYLVANPPRFHPELLGRVVTLTGASFVAFGETCYLFAPALLATDGEAINCARRQHLLPISDPDQPVDVTSDTDEPVTA